MSDSFRARVARFWSAFQKEEAIIRAMIDNSEKLNDNTASKHTESLLKMTFNDVNFQIGLNLQNKYELILSPDGDKVKLLLLNYWLQQSPEQLQRKWLFHASMPALAHTSYKIEMFGIALEENDITLYPSVDGKKLKFDLEIYSPKLLSIDDSARYTLTFLLLDQYISEIYTIEQIGDIVFSTNELDKPSIELKNLKEEIDKHIIKHNWKRETNPVKGLIGYKRVPLPGEENILRREIYEGYTTCSQIIHAYLSNDTAFFQKYNGDKVEFGFLYYANNQTSHDNILTIRNLVQNEIAAKTASIGIADCIGAAVGKHYTYLDYIIYDYELFIKTLKQVATDYDFKSAGFAFFNFEEKIIEIK